MSETRAELLDLSTDELSQILQSLDTKDIIHFALSCSYIYDATVAAFKELRPITLSEPWTLGKALALHRQISLTCEEDAETLVRHMNYSTYTLADFSTSLKIPKQTDSSYDNIIDVVSSPTGGESSLLCIRSDSDVIKERVLQNVSGHQVTDLVIKDNLQRFEDLLSILQFTVNVESLDVTFESSQNSSQCLHQHCLYHNLGKRDGGYYTGYQISSFLPVLTKLKRIKIVAHVLEASLLWLIQAAPNLEELDFRTRSTEVPMRDRFLQFVLESNLQLRRLSIKVDMGVHFTDNGIVDVVQASQLENIYIGKAKCVTPKVWRLLKPVRKASLKSIVIKRRKDTSVNNYAF
jgi:hypothetical protein